MKKFVTRSILYLFVSVSLFAVQRVVVVEEFTATWCTYCPGAARALDEIYETAYDSIIVIAYHSSSSDPFYTSEAAQRASYYNLSGYPTSYFDGIISEVGGLHNGTVYPIYVKDFSLRKNNPSDLDISLSCNYDSVSNTGTVTAVVMNTSSTSISGRLHFVIIEDEIPYNWQNMNKLGFVERDMLPDANGEQVTIAPGDTIMRSRNFTIASNWNEKNCRIVVFVQASNKEIYQGAETAVLPEPEPFWYDYVINEVSGNGNGVAEPGETVELKILAKNMGTGDYAGGGNISVNDAYVSIVNSNPYSISIPPGDVDTILGFSFDISPSCPDPHTVYFEISAGGITDTIPFIITTNPGFHDDMESGLNGWTHQGTFDNWHQTSHRSHTPMTSWYSGIENSWNYSNENDAKLISPYFVAVPGESLSYYTYYSLELNWDYGYFEINNGSDFWFTQEIFTGTQNSWVRKVYAMDNFYGKTVRIRFRFISDYSVTQEGWYIDDVHNPAQIVRISENYKFDDAINFALSSNILKDGIIMSLGGVKSEKGHIKIFNSDGQLVNFFNLPTDGKIVWKGVDRYNRKLPAGVYFIMFEKDNYRKTRNVLIIR